MWTTCRGKQLSGCATRNSSVAPFPTNLMPLILPNHRSFYMPSMTIIQLLSISRIHLLPSKYVTSMYVHTYPSHLFDVFFTGARDSIHTFSRYPGVRNCFDKSKPRWIHVSKTACKYCFYCFTPLLPENEKPRSDPAVPPKGFACMAINPFTIIA